MTQDRERKDRIYEAAMRAMQGMVGEMIRCDEKDLKALVRRAYEIGTAMVDGEPKGGAASAIAMEIALNDKSELSRRIVSEAQKVVAEAVDGLGILYATHERVVFTLADNPDLKLWARFHTEHKPQVMILEGTADLKLTPKLGPRASTVTGLGISVNGVYWVHSSHGITRVGEVV